MYLPMNSMEKRKRLSEVALGILPPDKVIRNGTVFNVFTGEFIKGQSIWIKDGRIAYVGPGSHHVQNEGTQVIDGEGRVLLPGLIDGHTHITSRTNIEEFIRYVIPGGTTTVITETIELATIAGKDGIDYFVKGLEGQPIRFFYTIPPLCGLTSVEEIQAPANSELLPLLQDPRCLGVGEIYWGNLFLEGFQGERVRELASMALDLGKRVEGHSAGATGGKLQAYFGFGISSCHESITEEEVIERLRLGCWVMIRQGSIRKELFGVKGIFSKKLDFRRLILSTDGMDPQGFLEEGYLDAALKTALKMGVPPEIVYQMVTLNVAEHFRIDHLVGSLSPGKMADLVIIPSPGEYAPQLVMCEGRVIFEGGKPTVEPRKVSFPDRLFHTVSVQDNPIPPIPSKGKVRVMELVSRLVTKEKILDLEDRETMRDVIPILALDRMGGEESFMGFLKGFGLQRGALGSTMTWDMTDLIVAGCDVTSMKTAIGRLQVIGGGAVYAIGNDVLAEFPAPHCGVISLKEMVVMREEMKGVEEALKNNGVSWERPVLTLDTLGSPAIPQLRITHRGYVRLKDREILPLKVPA
jgi:adenine deaminase